MDSGDYSAPPSFSSGVLKSVEPQFPAYNQPAEYAAQAPSISSTGIRNPEPQLPTDGQRTVAGEFQDQAPSYSDFQHAGNSFNQFSGGNGNRGMDQTDYGAQAPNLDALVHQNNSTTGFNAYNGYDQAPSLTGVAPRNPSNPGVSAATPAYDPLENVGFSIVGRNFPRQNLMDPYYN